MDLFFWGVRADEDREPDALSPRKEVMVMTNKQVTSALGALLVLLGLASCCPASNDSTYDPTEAEAQIRENARAWANVAVTGDPSVMETILANDFVGTSPDGKLYTKQDFINDIRANPLGFVSNEVNDVKVRFFGNVAVAQGYETFTRKDGATGRFVWTDVLVRRDGRWVTVAAQDVIAPAIPEPAAKALFDTSRIPEGQK